MSTDEEMCALKRQCVNLLFSCPLSRRDSACPFADARTHRDIVARVHWLRQRTAVELRKFVVHHRNCCQQPSGRQP